MLFLVTTGSGTCMVGWDFCCSDPCVPTAVAPHPKVGCHQMDDHYLHLQPICFSSLAPRVRISGCFSGLSVHRRNASCFPGSCISTGSGPLIDCKGMDGQNEYYCQPALHSSTRVLPAPLLPLPGLTEIWAAVAKWHGCAAMDPAARWPQVSSITSLWRSIVASAGASWSCQRDSFHGDPHYVRNLGGAQQLRFQKEDCVCARRRCVDQANYRAPAVRWRQMHAAPVRVGYYERD